MPRRVTLSGILITLFAVALFIVALRRAGLQEIQAGLRQIGWGFAAIVALSGVRLAARTFAWRSLLPAPPPAGEMLGATLAGEAVGNLLPLGPIAGEPAKLGYLRTRGPVSQAAAALGLENVFYSLSVAAVIVLGMSLLVAYVALPADLLRIAIVALVAMTLLVSAGVFALFRRPASRGSILEKLPRWMAAGRLRELEQKAYAYYASARGRTSRVVGFHLLFHLCGLAEVYIVLWLLAGAPPSLLHAFVLESAGRVINVAFRFVPMRLGVEEVGAEAASAALGLATGTGVLLGLTRKVRVLFWTGAGLIAIAHRGLSLNSLQRDSRDSNS